MILCVPFYLAAFSTHDLRTCTACLCLGGFLKYGFTAAQFAISQGVATARLRAVSTAIMMFVVNLMGTGLGPLFIGAVSDLLFKAQAARLGAPDLARKACEGAARGALSGDLQAVCAVAHPQSLQAAMMITSFVYVGAGVLFLVTSRWLRRDMVAK